MRTVSVFNFISLDGCFEGPVKGDIGWHRHDEVGRAYAVEMIARGNVLLFGRVTYDIMSSYWPTEAARSSDPVMAEGMNNAGKIVFSRTMDKAAWSNTTVIKDDVVERVREIKRSGGTNLTILGSGSIVKLFAENNVIDEYQFMVDPVVLGSGRRIFDGIEKRLRLTLKATRVFRNGSVLLIYNPAGED
ncbi:MAG: dihydrofolate reductase [Chlorobiaceae bacterium]|nr:dihydrofolate reductase [Chlorobiaceae bacterium]